MSLGSRVPTEEERVSKYEQERQEEPHGEDQDWKYWCA